jgi:dTDP-glucose pyrophosphorylase
MTLAIPKQLLMIDDKAIIEYVKTVMKLVGVTQIIIVV